MDNENDSRPDGIRGTGRLGSDDPLELADTCSLHRAGDRILAGIRFSYRVKSSSEALRAGKSGDGHCREGGWKGRWEGMSPEERERVRSLWKQRCRKSTPPPVPPAETES